MKPLLLDLFCGAGGCGMGYHRAGFDVVGVDFIDQPHYPFKFIRADALSYFRDYGHQYDVIHASPPCPKWSVGSKLRKTTQNHPDLLTPLRPLLDESSKPYIIENVPGSPLINPLVLNGLMFKNLRVLRERWFETNFMIPQPILPSWRKSGFSVGRQPGETGKGGYVTVAGHLKNREYCMKAMGIDWPMTRRELSNSIPPDYTQYIGEWLMDERF